MSKAWGKGSTRQWRKDRIPIFERDGYRCQLQIEGVCTYKATEIHHTHGRAVTGDDPQYMVASCKACNLKVGDPRAYSPEHKDNTQW